MNGGEGAMVLMLLDRVKVPNSPLERPQLAADTPMLMVKVCPVGKPDTSTLQDSAACALVGAKAVPIIAKIRLAHVAIRRRRTIEPRAAFTSCSSPETPLTLPPRDTLSQGRQPELLHLPQCPPQFTPV